MYYRLVKCQEIYLWSLENSQELIKKLQLAALSRDVCGHFFYLGGP
jgi:hypothetical protein